MSSSSLPLCPSFCALEDLSCLRSESHMQDLIYPKKTCVLTVLMQQTAHGSLAQESSGAARAPTPRNILKGMLNSCFGWGECEVGSGREGHPPRVKM